VRQEKKILDPEFIVDEQPSVNRQVKPFPEAMAGVLRRAHELQKHLSERRVANEGELRKQSDFLIKLIRVKEDFGDRLVRVEKQRQAESDGTISIERREEVAKWLRRVEVLVERIDGVLTSYGVTRFVPSGKCVPDRDNVQDTVSASGVESGTIVEVVEAGYFWRGEVLRHAVVVIAA
jgi:molecular chaperone GrpE (heat shock protein)